MKKTPPLTESQKAQILGDKPLSNISFPGKGQVISFWDMIQYFTAGSFASHIEALTRLIDRSSEEDSTTPLTKGQRNGMVELFDALAPYCFDDDMRISRNRLEAMSRGVAGYDETKIDTWGVLRRDLQAFEESFQDEMRKRTIMLLPFETQSYYTEEKLFGEKVFKTFRRARKDISSAGACLAIELSTAAVFHLMRATEHALRRLARAVQVTIPKTELDYKGWDTIIESIEAAIDTLLASPAPTLKSKRVKRLEFYHEAMKEFRAFEHVWRNPTMHTRKTHNMDDALAVWGHVKSFMMQLAGHLPK
jgi:hypothetical protein